MALYRATDEGHTRHRIEPLPLGGTVPVPPITFETLVTYSEKRRKEMAQEQLWRPADYPTLAVYAPAQTVYVPPQIRENWGFETRVDCTSAERSGAELGRRRKRSSRGLTYTVWNIVAWVCACALVAAIVAMVVAVFVLHLR